MSFIIYSVFFFLVTCGADPYLPNPSAFFELVKAGSIVIPMDNFYQSNGNQMNLKVYGLLTYLLENSIPLWWAISSNKTKDGVDFVANVSQCAPFSQSSAIRNSVIAFTAGPFVIPAPFNLTALSFILPFGYNLSAYYMLNDQMIDIRFQTTNKVRIGLMNHGGTYLIYQNYFIAGLLIGTVQYKVVEAIDLLVSTSSVCYSIAAEPPVGVVNITVANQVRTFMSEGRNFLAQSDAINAYESVGFYQTSTGIIIGDFDSPYMTFPYGSIPLTQFIGPTYSNSFGIVVDWTSTSMRENAYGVIYEDGNSDEWDATVSKFTSLGSPGGCITYLGGGNYLDGHANSTLQEINSIRLVLNTIMMPSYGPPNCAFSVPVAPLAYLITATIPAAGYVYFNVLNYVYDPIYTLNLTEFTITVNGILGTIASNGSGYIYRANNFASGVDSLRYQICNPPGACTIGIFQITIYFVHVAPVALPGSYAIPPNKTISMPVLSSAFSPNTVANFSFVIAPGSLAVYIAPLHGTAYPLNGQMVYTPFSNFTGVDSMYYSICDTYALCTIASITINVTSVAPIPVLPFNTSYVDVAPVANNDYYIINSTGVAFFNVTVNDFAPNGNLNISTIFFTTLPSTGFFSYFTSGYIFYQPVTYFNGSVTATYRICTTFGTCSNTATVNITVLFIVWPPQTVSDSITTIQNIPFYNLNPTVNDFFIESPINTSSLSIAVQALRGNATSSSGLNITYTPNFNYNGADFFTYTICNLAGGCSNGTVSVTILFSPVYPVANPDFAICNSTRPCNVNVTLNDTDFNRNIMPAYSAILVPPVYGSASISNGLVTYTSFSTSYVGLDNLTYQVCESYFLCSPGIATFSLAQTMLAVNDAYSIAFASPEYLNVTANDTSAYGIDPTSLNIIADPTFGLVEVIGGLILFDSGLAYYTSESFQYQICDYYGYCSTALVTINIVTSLELINHSVSAKVNVATVINVLQGYTVNASPEDPNIGINDTSLMISGGVGTTFINPNYTVTYRYDGLINDSFTYYVCTVGGLCDMATVFVYVTNVTAPTTMVTTVPTTSTTETVTTVFTTNTVHTTITEATMFTYAMKSPGIYLSDYAMSAFIIGTFFTLVIGTIIIVQLTIECNNNMDTTDDPSNVDFASETPKDD